VGTGKSRTASPRKTTATRGKLLSGVLNSTSTFKTAKGPSAPAPPKKRKRPPRQPVANDPYQRPKFNKSTKDKIWENAEKASPDGKVRDPLTGKVMDKKDRWDGGHAPDWEFRKHKAAAEQYGTNIYPRNQFVKDYNTPDHVIPELPSSNQSHAGEGKGDEWAKLLKNRYGTPPP
jgi:predicted ribonuclease toxin of YeeF-YezG toxin-antitoxin module